MRGMKYLLSCVVFAAFSIAAIAQTGAGSIQGTVTDNSGAVVRDAQITAVSAATNANRATTSSETGAYAIPNLAIGDYSVYGGKGGICDV